MNLSRIRTWLDAHETPVMVAGGGAVAALALYVRHKRAAGGASGAAAVTPAIAGLSGSPNTSATDEQNQVQDEINTQFGQLQQQLTDALAAQAHRPSPGGWLPPHPPVTTTPPPPAPSKPAPTKPPTMPPPAPKKPPAAPKTYTVVHGDTLSHIAAAHGLSLSALEKLNPQIHNFNLIYPGQKVNL